MVLSVIVICKNAMPSIKNCLKSIREQSFQPHELLIIDGNSTDGTIEYIKQQRNLTYIPQEGKGIANARNTGIKRAKGNLIAFLDADDLWMSKALEWRVNYLNQHQDITAVGGHLIKSDNESVKLPAYTPGGFIFRKEIFGKLGYFKERWKFASDHEWFKRLIEGSIEYKILPQTLLIKGIHLANTSLIYKKEYREEMMQILRLG